LALEYVPSCELQLKKVTVELDLVGDGLSCVMVLFILQVLNAVLTEANGKFNCFSSNEEAFCGNRIVEGGEQCDCGFRTDCNDPDHPDPCCYPQEDTNQCKRMGNAVCR
jgi:hypothetical protein